MDSYEVRWDGAKATLPRANVDRYDAMEFSVWGDFEENHRRFVASQRAKQTVGRGPVIVELCLVPRPDNEYNEYAVSVAAPPEVGSSKQDRHLGYLFDWVLARIGFATLPNLARYSDGVVYCTGIIYNKSADGFRLDLPSPNVLGNAVNRFLSAPTTPPLTTRPPLPGTEAQVLDAQARTTAALRDIATFPSPSSKIAGVTLRTHPSFRHQPRSIGIDDAATGRPLGSVDRGLLHMFDERDREQTLAFVSKHGIDVAQPSEADLSSITPRNIATIDALRTVQFRANGASYPVFDQTVAHYNRRTQVLWVQDAAFVNQCLEHARRLGIRVQATQVPSRAWRLADEVPARTWGDYETNPRLMEMPIPMPAFSEAAFDLIPGNLLAGVEFEGVSGEIRASNDPPDWFVTCEQFVQERFRFGRHELTNQFGACRICGREAALFRAKISQEPLAYCQTCLNYASTGVRVTREQAVEAIRLVSDLEFGGEAMLEAQFRNLHVNPAEMLPPSEIDRRLLLRFFVDKGRWSWIRLLSDAGLANQGIRMSRGTIIRAQDGHLCLSKGEKLVDDFLHQNGIAHEREPLYPFDSELNVNGRRRADWILTDGTLVELWGMAKVPEYAAKMVEKTRLAERYKINLVTLVGADLLDLPRVFARWLESTPSPMRDADDK